tara:strand:+ start:16092 stop:17807 length:1716 start_codon:yes stop_codon:yes gene_type:complete
MATTQYDISDQRYALAVLAKERAEREQREREGLGYSVKAGANLFKSWQNEQNIMMKEKIATDKFELNPDYQDSNFFKRMFTPWEERVRAIEDVATDGTSTYSQEDSLIQLGDSDIDASPVSLERQTDVSSELLSDKNATTFDDFKDITPFEGSSHGQGTIDSLSGFSNTDKGFIPGVSKTHQDLVNEARESYNASIDPLTNTPAGSDEFFNLREQYSPEQLTTQRNIESGGVFFEGLDKSDPSQYGLSSGPSGMNSNLPSLDEIYQGSPALSEDIKAAGESGKSIEDILSDVQKKTSDAYRANYDKRAVEQSGLSLEELESGETVYWDESWVGPQDTLELPDHASDLYKDGGGASLETSIDIHNLNETLPIVKDSKLVSRELGGKNLINKDAALGKSSPGDLIVNPDAPPLSLNNQFKIDSEIGSQFKPGGKFYSEASSLRETAKNVAKEGAVIPGVKLASPDNSYTKTDEFKKILEKVPSKEVVSEVGKEVSKEVVKETGKEAGKATIGQVAGAAGLGLSVVDAGRNWDKMSSQKKGAKVAEIGLSAAAMAGLINPLWGVGLALGSGLLD